jgi:hypothetical protein
VKRKYVLLVNLLTAAFADTVIAKMVSKGWTIRPLTNEPNEPTLFKYRKEGMLGAVLSVIVYKSEGTSVEALDLMTDAETVLESAGISYFSISVYEAGHGSEWRGSNIQTEQNTTMYSRLDSTKALV